jgi:two-component system, LytTR family, sensor kinase
MQNPISSQASEPQPHLASATALASIFGFWLFYGLIVTLRSSVMDFPAQGELATRRVFVTLAGMAITVFVWQAMRLVDRRPLPWRVITAAVVCIPAAFAIAAANFYFFNIFDQASLMDVEQLRAEAGISANVWLEVAEVAVSRYFFLIAWSALYLALSYAQDVRIAERRAASFERAAQMSELRALRFQLNPHFLFNTLNSLSSLVMHGRRDEAESVILNLASFYRASLSGDPSGDVTLAEEIAGQRLYFDIEAVRFPDRLSVVIALPEELESVHVPGLILQPLVENAIKHGVSRTSNPVTVQIKAWEDGSRLFVSVSDTAPAGAGDSGFGVGLANVRDRLAARFGSDATLTAHPVPGGGFTASIALPLVRHD